MTPSPLDSDDSSGVLIELPSKVGRSVLGSIDDSKLGSIVVVVIMESCMEGCSVFPTETILGSAGAGMTERVGTRRGWS